MEFIIGLILFGIALLPLLLSIVAFVRTGAIRTAHEKLEQIEAELSTLRLRQAATEAALKKMTATASAAPASVPIPATITAPIAGPGSAYVPAPSRVPAVVSTPMQAPARTDVPPPVSHPVEITPEFVVKTPPVPVPASIPVPAISAPPVQQPPAPAVLASPMSVTTAAATGGAIATAAASTSQAPRPAVYVSPHAATPPPLPPRAITPQAPAVPRLSAPPPVPAAVANPPTRPPTPPPPMPPPVPAARKLKLEELLGTKLFLWLGGGALGLAGVYMVKLSIERGIITEPMRVAFGMIFGAALLGVGQWLHKRAPPIASAVSAAGIFALYAVLLAAHHHYHLIPRTPTFLLLAGVTAAAVVLSLRQGMIVAVLGMIGGFLAPALIGRGDSRPEHLFIYLLLLQGGLLAVSRLRGWAWVAGFSQLLGLIWVAVFLLPRFYNGTKLWPLGSFLLLSTAAMIASTFGLAGKKAWGSTSTARLLGAGTLLFSLILNWGLLRRADYSPTTWGFLALVGAGCLVLARLDDGYHLFAWLAGGANLVLLALWGFSAPTAPAHFGAFILVFGALYGLGAYLAMWKSGRETSWAALAVVVLLLHPLLAWRIMPAAPPPFTWGQIALGLAVLTIAAQIPIVRRRELIGDWAEVLSAFAVAATAFVSMAVPLELDRRWIAAGWALELPALAFIHRRLRVAGLQSIAAVVAVLVAVRLLFNPFVLDYPIGTTIFFNWLLYGYGVPIAAVAVAARLFRQDKDAAAVVLGDQLAWIAGALGFVFVGLQVRHYFHPRDLHGPGVFLAEWGAWGAAWLATGIALAWVDRRAPWPARNRVAAVFSAVGLLTALIGCGVAANPWFTAHPAGDRLLFNVLLFSFGLPAGLALLTAAMRRNGDAAELAAELAAFLESGGWLLTMLLVTLEVRQGFHGRWLQQGSTGYIERFTYALAWSGLLLILAECARRRPVSHLHVLMALLTTVILSRLMFNPFAVDYPAGRWAMLGWLAYGYALPALLGFIASWRLKAAESRAMRGGLDVFTLTFALFWLTRSVHHYFHPVPAPGAALLLLEWGTGSLVLLAAGWSWLRFAEQANRRPAAIMAQIYIALGLIAGLLGAGLIANPWITGGRIDGVPVFNTLLLVYAPPALIAWLIGADMAKRGRTAAAAMVQSGSLILLFLLVTLEVRHLFHGEFLRQGTTWVVEWSVWSMAWLAIGWGLLALSHRKDNAVLSAGGGAFTALGLLAMLGGVGLIANPWLTGEAVGSIPLLDKLLLICVGPALLAWGIGEQARRRGGATRAGPEMSAADGLQAAALGMGVLFITLEALRLLHGPVLNSAGIGFAEWGVWGVVWLAAGWGLEALGEKFKRPLLSGAGTILVALGLLAALGGASLLANPLWTMQRVGALPIFNWITWIYVPVTFMAVMIGRRWRIAGAKTMSLWAYLAALLLAFWGVTLEVRQLFHGTDLAGKTMPTEQLAYSAAWAILGTVLLVLAIRRRTRLLRFASLAVILLTCFKVFLHDIGRLTGFVMVFSLFGLGVTLLLIAWLYQRFVFKGESE